jgi:cytochrome c oxidase cbb3-type subunit 3
MTRPLSVAVVLMMMAGAPAAQRTALTRDAGGYPAPTAALERGRTVYVLSSCHFCHGVDLTGAQMGAADLMHDPLIASDTRGEVIGAIVLAGLPNLQTAMPKYADMTPQQIRDLAAYIHFLRAQGRFRELTAASNQLAGNAAAGKIYFAGAGQCGTCHSVDRDLAGVSTKYSEPALRAAMLRPGVSVPREGVDMSAGGAAHQKILENLSAEDARNLLAYLRTL